MWRKEEGGGLASIEDCIDSSIEGLKEYKKEQRNIDYSSQ